jgi:hypothetical protein
MRAVIVYVLVAWNLSDFFQTHSSRIVLLSLYRFMATCRKPVAREWEQPAGSIVLERGIGMLA